MHLSLRTIIVSVLGSTLLLACSSSEDGSGSAPAEPDAVAHDATSTTVGPMTFDLPLGWIQEPPESSMRAGQFALPGEGPATLVVFFFGVGGGGSVDANFTRWAKEMTQPDGRASADVAERSSETRDGIKFHSLDVSGNYSGGRSGAGGSNWRLLGTIVECDGGPYFFKLTGPAETVKAVKADYDALLASLEAPATSS